MLNCFVFAATTLAIMGIVYEGYALEWFPLVGIFILTADGLFMLSTVLNLIICRKNKVILSFSIISLVAIVTLIVCQGGKLFSAYSKESIWQSEKGYAILKMRRITLICVGEPDRVRRIVFI